MMVNKFILILVSILLISSCSDNFESRISGSSDNIVIQVLSEKDVLVNQVYVLTTSKNKDGLADNLWEISYPELRGRSEEEKIRIIRYGITPKGFNQIVFPKKLTENIVYLYYISAGKFSGTGCFYIKNNQVVQNNMHCT